ncbi:uncharacterized protein LOC134563018 isoform X2 [Prinia subflava]|uniref:uncharacterized protein LOC134563018 isoform X2 n=1 Tax=Prinia subflava TaxID=208062 RepID=UPI002FE2A508
MKIQRSYVMKKSDVFQSPEKMTELKREHSEEPEYMREREDQEPVCHLSGLTWIPRKVCSSSERGEAAPLATVGPKVWRLLLSAVGKLWWREGTYVISGKFTGTFSWDFLELRKHIPLTLTLQKRPTSGPALNRSYLAKEFHCLLLWT